MKKEDIQAALEAIGKGGIQVAGDLVLEKHVEYEVANVEEGGIGIQVINGSAPKVANAKNQREKKDANEKPAKPRETMTFGLKSGVTDGHLNVLYQKLVDEGWMWLGKFGKGTLVELFKIFAGAKVIEVPKGFSIPSILEGHFKDTKGKWLTGLDKGDKANCKASSLMYEFVKILQIDLKQWKYGDEDNDEDFREEYDLYDHQDLHVHSR